MTTLSLGDSGFKPHGQIRVQKIQKVYDKHDQREDREEQIVGGGCGAYACPEGEEPFLGGSAKAENRGLFLE